MALVHCCRDGDTAMGQGDGEQQGDADGSHVTQTAPALLWKPERVAADLKLSRQLIEKLDQEKDIISNPLIAADELTGTPTGSSYISVSCCASRWPLSQLWPCIAGCCVEQCTDIFFRLAYACFGDSYTSASGRPPFLHDRIL